MFIIYGNHQKKWHPQIYSLDRIHKLITAKINRFTVMQTFCKIKKYHDSNSTPNKDKNSNFTK